MCSLQGSEASFQLTDNALQVFGGKQQSCGLSLFQPGFRLGQVGAQLRQHPIKIERPVSFRFFQALEAKGYVRNDMRLLLYYHLIAELLRPLSQAKSPLMEGFESRQVVR